jgi:hypothetical protein
MKTLAETGIRTREHRRTRAARSRNGRSVPSTRAQVPGSSAERGSRQFPRSRTRTEPAGSCRRATRIMRGVPAKDQRLRGLAFRPARAAWELAPRLANRIRDERLDFQCGNPPCQPPLARRAGDRNPRACGEFARKVQYRRSPPPACRPGDHHGIATVLHLVQQLAEILAHRHRRSFPDQMMSHQLI